MPNQVWGRDPQEAYENPYEYGVQEQFVREATKILNELYKLLQSRVLRFTVQQQTVEKAVWLLHVDALDSLRDSLQALQRKNHRVAAKMFRDIIETLDLAQYFRSGTPSSKFDLVKWYKDEIIPHKKSRKHVKKTSGEEIADRKAKQYSSLSRFSHRSYRAILDGYSVGAGDRLVHDKYGFTLSESQEASDILVLPQTIAAYFAYLAELIMVFTDELRSTGAVSEEQIKTVLDSCLEGETLERRFVPHYRLKDLLTRQ